MSSAKGKKDQSETSGFVDLLEIAAALDEDNHRPAPKRRTYEDLPALAGPSSKPPAPPPAPPPPVSAAPPSPPPLRASAPPSPRVPSVPAPLTLTASTPLSPSPLPVPAASAGTSLGFSANPLLSAPPPLLPSPRLARDDDPPFPARSGRMLPILLGSLTGLALVVGGVAAWTQLSSRDAARPAQPAVAAASATVDASAARPSPSDLAAAAPDEADDIAVLEIEEEEDEDDAGGRSVWRPSSRHRGGTRSPERTSDSDRPKPTVEAAKPEKTADDVFAQLTAVDAPEDDGTSQTAASASSPKTTATFSPFAGLSASPAATTKPVPSPKTPEVAPEPPPSPEPKVAAATTSPKPESPPAKAEPAAAVNPNRFSSECLLDPTLPECKPAKSSTPAPTPTAKPAPTANLPEKLALSQIRSSVDPFKKKAKSCASKFATPPGTKVRVKLSISGATGKVISAQPLPPHGGDPAGECVADTLKDATFPKFKADSQGTIFPVTL